MNSLVAQKGVNFNVILGYGLGDICFYSEDLDNSFVNNFNTGIGLNYQFYNRSYIEFNSLVQQNGYIIYSGKNKIIVSLLENIALKYELIQNENCKLYLKLGFSVVKPTNFLEKFKYPNKIIYTVDNENSNSNKWYFPYNIGITTKLDRLEFQLNFNNSKKAAELNFFLTNFILELHYQLY